MKFAQLFILILAFLFINQASAGVLVEPVLGYSFSKVQVSDTGFSEEKASGPSFGGRLGYQNLGFQLGVDYLQSNLDVDDNDYSSLKTKEWAGFIGFEFPVLLRVYAGYIFSALGDTKYDSGSGNQKLKLQDGSGAKFGLGFTGLPFIDINFEYRKGSFGEYKYQGSTHDKDMDFEAFMVGVSLPFVL